MKTYTLFIVFLFLGINPIIAQDAAVFEKAKEVGTKFAKHLKQGEIAPLASKKPVSKTWAYKKIEKYKEYLATKKLVVYGSFINPTSKKDLYDFNVYALRKDGDRYYYFYTMSVIVSARDNEYKVLDFMLFTEEDALKIWWQSTFRFFESAEFKTIPKSVINPNICPPQPSF